MAAGINSVTVLGQLGRDPEVRYGQSGTAVANLSVGVTTRQKKGDTWEDETEWVRVVCFGKTAENCGQYLQKGRSVAVQGRMRTQKYLDKKTNVEKYSTEVVADSVQFLGEPQGGGQRAAPGGNRPQGNGKPAPRSTGGSAQAEVATSVRQAGNNTDGFVDDDLPF